VRFAILLTLSAVLAAALPLGAARAEASDWAWPVTGEVVTSYSYGVDRYARGQHRGIDVGAAPGTPVVAARAGTVRFAGSVGTSGLVVALRTADGRFDTSYLHLSAPTVAAGDRVAVGQRIGAVGVTGRPSSSQPHLHFSVRDAGTEHGYRNPLTFLPAPLTDGPRHDRPPTAAPAPVRLRPVRFEPRAVPSAERRIPNLGWALACLASIALAVVVGRSSIGGSCRTTSQPRSTTSTASPTWATSTRRSLPTSSRGTCASAATTSSS
jgi:hypothetical protein